MKGFLILAYNNSEEDNISVGALQNELHRKKIGFSATKLSNALYHKVLGFQFYKQNDIYPNADNIHFVAGDVYGRFEEQNSNLLSYTETAALLKNSTVENNYLPLEGNACIASVFHEKIIVQNDIEGYRKIFYFKKNGLLCISTDLPLIFKAVKKQWEVRKNAVISYIGSRESKWPFTFVDEIYSLPPLSRAEISSGGNLGISSRSFSDFYELKKISRNGLKEQLYSQYASIVKRKQGENIAVTLSGGYDSNCLTKLYTQIFPNQFSAVSVGYEAKRERDGNIYDETIYAKKIAERLGIPFKRYFFTRNDFFSGFPSFIEGIDQPGHDPSSNFIMNRHLRADGFDLVVNGMGGDGNFAHKRNSLLAMQLHTMYKTLPGKILVDAVAQNLNFRGPFGFFSSSIGKPQESTFHDLWERKQLFSLPVNTFIDQKAKLELDTEREKRSEFFEGILSKANTKQEIFYSFAIFGNPDEYHATLSAERNNMEILMPFVNAKAAMMVMNGSKFHKIDDRQFEMEIFGGIEKELLARSKSGFSIPYSEWLPPFADEVFNFFLDRSFFNKNGFDVEAFRKKYNTDRDFASASMANSVLWKLLVVKEYVKMHDLK